MSCSHARAAVDETGKIDFARKICLEGPPTPIGVLGPGNVPTIASFYPPVDKNTPPCDRFAASEEAVAVPRSDA